jgi:uncharacterized protein YdeI (YjbR/CyaY-like superfamily)
MAGKALNTLDVRTASDWRTWLEEHHASVTEVWLVFHKKATGRTSIDYLDALDEALCFGWIDSLVRRLDDERFARKFTPRKPDSRWSDVNRKRYAELRASGRLQEPGKQRAPTSRRSVKPARLPWTKVPAYMQEALERNRAARATFESLAPGYRRQYVGWVDSAKQQETKLRRLREAIQLLAAGRKLGLK